jgi:hypothetical protein
MLLLQQHKSSVADPDPNLFGRIWIRIRILVLINDHKSTFLECVKAIDTLEISIAELFGSLIYFLEHISTQKKIPEESYIVQEPDPGEIYSSKRETN